MVSVNDYLKLSVEGRRYNDYQAISTVGSNISTAINKINTFIGEL